MRPNCVHNKLSCNDDTDNRLEQDQLERVRIIIMAMIIVMLIIMIILIIVIRTSWSG